MNGRRGFMKTIVGAFVASAIEIRMAAAPVIEAVQSATFNPVDYVGEYRWVNVDTGEVTRDGIGPFRGFIHVQAPTQ